MQTLRYKLVAVENNNASEFWGRINNWLKQDRGFCWRAALLFTGMGLTADFISQAISLYYGNVDRWDYGRTAAMLIFPALDAQLLTPTWNTLFVLASLPKHCAIRRLDIAKFLQKC